MTQPNPLVGAEFQSLSEQELFENSGISPDTDFSVRGPNAISLRAAIEREVYNDDQYDIADLTDDEKAKLHFIVIPTSHTAQFAHDVVVRATNADYVLLESVGFTEQQRLCIDAVDNIMLRGGQVDVPRHNVAYLEARTLETGSDWRSFIQRTYRLYRPNNPPIFRTIDIASDDPDFNENHVSIDLLAVAAMDEDLYGKSYDDLKAETLAKLHLAGEVIRTREAEQLEDITRIAAKAVRMHPQRQSLTIAVSIGAAHSMVGRNLERMGLSVDIDHAGPAADMPHDILTDGGSSYSYDIATALLRKATHCPEAITEEDLDCLVSFRLIQNAIDEFMDLPDHAQSDGRIAYLFESAASALVYQLEPHERLAMLQMTEERSASTLPLLRELRVGIAYTRTNRAVIEFIEQKVGDLDAFVLGIGKDLQQR